MKKVSVAAVMAAISLVAAPALSQAPGAAQAVEPVVVPLTEVGAHNFEVPADVHCINVDAIGAQGGQGGANTAIGGLGGEVEQSVTVLPGQTLQINVGGVGGAGAPNNVPGAGGSNGGGAGGDAPFVTQNQEGGGGGGGASDVRQGGTDLTDRALVAAGGGGAGTFSAGGAGGTGGDPGQDGANGSGSQGGGGATVSAGGAGGNGNPPSDATLHGEDGTFGGGGTGGGGANSNGGGGGGGGGVFGGGGAGAVAEGFSSSGGGGGGANFSSPFSNSNTGVDADNDGNGRVTLSYVVGDTSCILAPLTVDKVVTGSAPFAPDTLFGVNIDCADPVINLGTFGLPGASSNVFVLFTTDASGVVHAVTGQTIAFFGPTECSVTEATDGGATSVSYGCAATVDSREELPVEPVNDGFGAPGANAVGPFPEGCGAPGPQAGPMAVHVIDPSQAVTVTVTNANDPVLEIAPRFTG